MAALRSDGVIDSAYCAREPTKLALWVNPCFCFSASSNYIKATPADADADADDAGEARFTIDPASGSRDLILRDAIAGSDIVRIHPKATSWRNRFNVYRSESLLFSIRQAQYLQWSLKLSVFLAPLGVSIKDHEELDEDNRAPDYTLERAPDSWSGLQVLDSQNQRIAEAKINPDSWIPGCGCFSCGPDYRVNISPGIDQAFIVVLLSAHYIISERQRQQQQQSTATPAPDS